MGTEVDSMPAPPMKELGPGAWLQSHPLLLAGAEFGREVTLFRLGDGRLIIHSTAPFSEKDVAAIEALGTPALLLDATNLHDTAAVPATAAFPDLPYLAPERFPLRKRLPGIGLLEDGAREWGEELEFIELGGMPKIQEHVFFHPASRTLVITDLLFHLPEDMSSWTRGFLRVASGIRQYPGMSRLFRFAIKDRAAFQRSLDQIFDWNFDRVVVGHGVPIEKDARAAFREALARHGF